MTSFVCSPGRPQKSHGEALAFDIDGNDDSAAGRADLRYGAARLPGESRTADDYLELVSDVVTLTLNDATRQNDALKIEDGQAIVLQFVGSVDRNDVLPGPDEVAKARDR